MTTVGHKRRKLSKIAKMKILERRKIFRTPKEKVTTAKAESQLNANAL